MKITPRSEALKNQTPVDPAHFTGKAGLRALIQASQLTPMFAAVVRFEARGQAPQRIRLDDTVTSDPGEEHWHGAGSHGPMTHIAVAVGETRWLEESAPPPD
jgi:hypothetical protein